MRTKNEQLFCLGIARWKDGLSFKKRLMGSTQKMRARGEPPVLDAVSDRRIDLGGQRRSSGAIEPDGEDSHRPMVQRKSTVFGTVL
jgi:hypothetical protein